MNFIDRWAIASRRRTLATVSWLEDVAVFDGEYISYIVMPTLIIIVLIPTILLSIPSGIWFNARYLERFTSEPYTYSKPLIPVEIHDWMREGF